MVLSMKKWVGKVAVVTGASTGIGLSISEHLVRAGLKVVAIDKQIDSIQQLQRKFILICGNGHLFSYKADFSLEEDILNAFNWVVKEVGPVYVLINNSGIIHITNLMEGDTKKWAKVFNTNVMGLCVATREAIKSMKENDIEGHVIHINSIAGHRIPHYPKANVYPASKFAVTALTETLRQELRENGDRIKITSISPGSVQNEAFLTENSQNRDMIEAAISMPFLKPEDVADAVLYALSTPSHVQIHELTITPVHGEF